jgi:hypothetical protein
MGLKVFSFGAWNYLPAGMVGVVFAALSCWAEEVPRLYRYKIITGSGSPLEGGEQQDGSNGDVGSTSAQTPGLTLSDKSTTYALAAQLAFSQFPYQLLPAAVGWMIGSAWMGELLPGGLSRWRVPSWMVGESSKSKERGQYEGLRRRLEEEGSSADGMRNVSDNAPDAGREEGRRGFGRTIAGYFTGS